MILDKSNPTYQEDFNLSQIGGILIHSSYDII